MFIQKLKQCTALIVILFLLTTYSLPVRVFADDLTPTPTDTPTPTVTVDNNANTQNTNNSSANSGSNTVDIPTPSPTDTTPTPTPTDTVSPTPTDSVTPTVTDSPTPSPIVETNITPCPTPTVDPLVTPDPSITPVPCGQEDLSATNAADTTNNVNSTSISGSNAVSSNSSSAGDGTKVSVNTGDSVINSNVVNNINTLIQNSDVTHQVINFFVDKNGDVNASDPLTLASIILNSSHQDDPVINVAVTNVNNYSYLSNDVTASANSGENTVTAPGSSVAINTGNAYSLVSLINNVNFTVVNSKVHIITINIFGDLNGNIVLPNSQANATTNCAACGVSLNVNNAADVTNTVDSSAVSGQNNVTTTGGMGNITTGTAKSAVNVVNVENSNYVGVFAQLLYVNLLGNWDGSFVGWDNLAPESGGASLSLTNISPNSGTCADCGTTTNVQNTAVVVNHVSSNATSGGNTINGNSAAIATGKAYSAVSLLNFINSTFVNSIGFFGFVNVFGNWHGSIGGAKEFAALSPTPTPTPEVQTASVNTQNTAQETGGNLAVSETNDAVLPVSPGSVVNFSATVKNIGSGKVYGTTLHIELLHNGVHTGGATIQLGDIDAGKGKKVTTGIVLSSNIPEGAYDAVAIATGNVGPNNALITATATSIFSVGGTILTTALLLPTPSTPKSIQSVLGVTHTPKTANADNSRDIYLLISAITGYVIIRALRKKENLKLLFQNSLTIAERMQELRMFLL